MRDAIDQRVEAEAYIIVIISLRALKVVSRPFRSSASRCQGGAIAMNSESKTSKLVRKTRILFQVNLELEERFGCNSHV